MSSASRDRYACLHAFVVGLERFPYFFAVVHEVEDESVFLTFGGGCGSAVKASAPPGCPQDAWPRT